jgi:hypothetical protein
MKVRDEGVFLMGIENTFLDNDHFEADLGNHFGKQRDVGDRCEAGRTDIG